jgi:formamidopyrimidine-DNA glycosylase
VPELPDITLYLEALERRISGRVLVRTTLVSPFVLRSVAPPLEAVHGRRVRALRRIGKCIVIGFDRELFLVIHLMIAGRLHWHESEPKLHRRRALVAFTFDSGTLVLTEAGTTRRALMHLVTGEAALAAFDRG